MPPSIRRLVLLSLLKLLTTACIHAESDKRGHLVGSVSLPDGTPVSGAMISVINEDRMFSALLMSPQPITESDKTGRFRTELLPHGTYTVLVFGNKTHVGLSARPASGVTLPSGSSAPPDLILEKRLTTVLRIKKKIKYQSSGDPFYYLKSPIHPLVNGLATKALFLRLGSDQLNISVIPGPFQISPDASFHPESEIHTFEVTADGKEHYRNRPSNRPYRGRHQPRLSGGWLGATNGQKGTAAPSRRPTMDRYQIVDRNNWPLHAGTITNDKVSDLLEELENDPTVPQPVEVKTVPPIRW